MQTHSPFLSFQIFFSNSTQLVKMTCDDADCLSTNALFSFGTGKERRSMFQVVSIHKHGRDSQDTHLINLSDTPGVAR